MLNSCIMYTNSILELSVQNNVYNKVQSYEANEDSVFSSVFVHYSLLYISLMICLFNHIDFIASND